MKKLDWESTFFEKNIAGIDIPPKQSGKILCDQDFDLIVVNQSDDTVIEIPDFTLTFEEQKVIFTKELSNISSIYHQDILDTDNYPRTPNFFYPLAYESGKFSRFRLDPIFGEHKFKLLYEKWVENSLNKTFAEKIFFIEQDGVCIGFITVQISNGIGKIGLIATLPQMQGKGLGRKLLETAEYYCISNGIYNLHIPTQYENTPACNFYKKMGYQINQRFYIKHFWKK